MKRELRVIINPKKTTEESFMAALIDTPPFPKDVPTFDGFTGLAVIAANDQSTGQGIYGFSHLHSDEKAAIGDAMAEACVPINTWVWCEMFDNGISPSWRKEFPKHDGDFFYSGKLPSGKAFVGIVQVSTHPQSGRHACVYLPYGWRGDKAQEAEIVFGKPEEWEGEWSGPEYGLSCAEEEKADG